MSKVITVEMMHTIAGELEGTCGDLDDAVREHCQCEVSEVPIPMLQELDSIVMACESCGWWSASEYLDEDSTCSDCRED